MSSLELLIVIPSRWPIALMVFSTSAASATAVIRMLPGILSIAASVIVIVVVIVVVASLVAATSASATATLSVLISRVAAALTHRVVVERERLEWAARRLLITWRRSASPVCFVACSLTLILTIVYYESTNLVYNNTYESF